MKVNNLLATCLLLVACVAIVYADTTDSVRISVLEQSLNSEIQIREGLQKELGKINSALLTLTKSTQKNSADVETLQQEIIRVNDNVVETANKLGVEIDDANNLIGEKASTSDLKEKTLYGIICFILLVIICALIYLFLRLRISKGNANIEALREKAEKLNEEIVSNFSTEMSEMQKISASLSAISSTSEKPIGVEQDHSLIKTLADRITFMEMTLSKMDASVRGYKQLSKSIAQMKDNLRANGYELVDMLGKAYSDGMKVTANFVEDENLEQGQQIITGIVKPQINFNGVMIQAAQITVSQNI